RWCSIYRSCSRFPALSYNPAALGLLAIKDGRYNRFNGDDRALQQLRPLARAAVIAHRNRAALATHPAIPTLVTASLDGNHGGHTRRQYALLITARLSRKPLQARGRNHARGHIHFQEPLRGGAGHRYLRAGGNNDRIRAVRIALPQHIGPTGSAG